MSREQKRPDSGAHVYGIPQGRLVAHVMCSGQGGRVLDAWAVLLRTSTQCSSLLVSQESLERGRRVRLGTHEALHCVTNPRLGWLPRSFPPITCNQACFHAIPPGRPAAYSCQRFGVDLGAQDSGPGPCDYDWGDGIPHVTSGKGPGAARFPLPLHEAHIGLSSLPGHAHTERCLCAFSLCYLTPGAAAPCLTVAAACYPRSRPHPHTLAPRQHQLGQRLHVAEPAGPAVTAAHT